MNIFAAHACTGALVSFALTGPSSAQCASWSDALGGLDGVDHPRDVVEFDDGSGSSLWLAYTGASMDSLNYGGVKRQSGTAWIDTMPTTQGSGTTSLVVFDEGQGPRLFAGGHSGVRRLDGATWTTLGPADLHVQDLAVVDLGAGPELFACGGSFGSAAMCIAQRSQGAWVAFGQGLGGPQPSDLATIYELAAFDAGSGVELYVAGQINLVSVGAYVPLVRRSSGGWSAIGPQTTTLQPVVKHVVVHDDGNGPALFAGFDAVGVATSIVARFDGVSWTTLPGQFELSSTGSPTIFALESADDDASGQNELFVGGRFTSISGVPAVDVARFDGTSWSQLGTGLGGIHGNGSVGLLRRMSGLSGIADHVVVGGAFSDAGGLSVYRLATWEGCGAIGTTLCAGDGSGAACPCANYGAAGSGCANSLGNGARFTATGSPSVHFDTVLLECIGMPNSTGLYLQGTQTIGGGAGSSFGDGLRCAGGTVVRLAVKVNVAGASRYPEAGDASVAVRGVVPASGGSRTYQVWYRNAATFCTFAAFNLSNGLDVTWTP